MDKDNKKKKSGKSGKKLHISDVISSFDDFDEQNYEIAKIIFFKEEGREPNMNDTKDMNLVAALEVGVRYTRNYL
jgi:hypothetical protein